MSDENNNTGTDDENVKEPTGVKAETNVEEPETDAEGAQGQEDDLAHWKRMSRKNENDFKKAAKERDQMGAQLAEANMRIARMEATAKYPSVTADVLDMLCKETTPEGVAEWAEAYARLNGGAQQNNEATQAEEPEDDKPASTRSAVLNLQAAKLSQRHDGSSMSKPSSYSSYYEEYMRKHQDDAK